MTDFDGEGSATVVFESNAVAPDYRLVAVLLGMEPRVDVGDHSTANAGLSHGEIFGLATSSGAVTVSRALTRRPPVTGPPPPPVHPPFKEARPR